MLPTDFPERNFVYTKPDGWKDDECMDLPVHKGTATIEGTDKKVHVIISCWKLNKEDLEEIQRTGCIWLSITGQGMPPVWIYTERPFTT